MWQKLILDLSKKKYPQNIKVNYLINWLYNHYSDGFYVNANRDITSKKEATQYIGRYVGRPAISESRIKSYDQQTVVITYTDHQTKEYVEERLEVIEFIKRVIIHIAENHFKMTRYYGLYANRNKRKKMIKFFRDGYDQIKKKKTIGDGEL